MAQKLEALRGMEDILPGDIEKWYFLEQSARVFFEAYGFKEIRTPLLELTDLFNRSVGEASDIVHKEMFSFTDRGGREVSLRPEMTASVARSVIEKGLLSQAKSLRLYYIATMFRAERPQAGRKRQFHQIGIEIVNEPGGEADFEAIRLLHDFLAYVGIQGIKMRVNDLGSFEDQKKMTESLKAYFKKDQSALCPDCLWRLEKNVLRIFDCKVESCQKMISGVDWDKVAPLSQSFKDLTGRLTENQISHEVKRRLVRGLDYYNGTVFEVASESLGAQDALAGGGRYDRLHSDLGGKPTPCTGFSIGVERLLMALEKEPGSKYLEWKKKKVYFAALGTQAAFLKQVYRLALELREKGILVEIGSGDTKLAKHLKKANQAEAKFTVIVGEEEIQKKKAILKNMELNEQKEVELDNLSAVICGELKK